MNNANIYTKNELYNTSEQKTYDKKCKEVAFLLGGIGTGNVSIGARGELRDWEIFNKPNKGGHLPYTFFSIRTKVDDEEPIIKALEGTIEPPYNNTHGFTANMMYGIPRFEESSLRGEYPFAFVQLKDSEMPVSVTLEAYTPFIPLNPEDSGIPCAILKYKVKNITDKPVDVSMIGTLANSVGGISFDNFNQPIQNSDYKNKNEYRNYNDNHGIYMYAENIEEDNLLNGSMSIIVKGENITKKTTWYKGAWWDCGQDFINDLMEDGLLNDEEEKLANDGSVCFSNNTVGSIGRCCTLQPYAEEEFEFIITWYFPNRVKEWENSGCSCENPGVTKNYYTRLFKDAWDIGVYLNDNSERLYSLTKKFHKCLFDSTLPAYVLDALSSNITVVRSTTCFWLENGKFAAWEGCSSQSGCCHGTCTHVWNYAQTVAFLFPTLEENMRLTEFQNETCDDGKMSFRSMSVFDLPGWDFYAAADGQLGTIIRLYREWKISGNTQIIVNLWDKVKACLDYAFTQWDSDGDYLLDYKQHNTYDIEFYGPNSLVNSMLFGALKAAIQMAIAIGDDEAKVQYEKAFKLGSEKMDSLLWSGEYYIQKIEDVNLYRYQYGEGCLSDQLFGQLLCHVAGLGYILPREHVKKAVKSIYDYNFFVDFKKHNNVQRVYTLNDEKGLVLCSWPKGGRPRFPFTYSDEVWTGIEYQVAAHLIFEGYVDEGLTIVKAVRERHDGIKRNPWNEVECGNHYARSMSSWAVLIAISGFSCDMVKKEIKFSPAIKKENFKCFFSTGKAWGTFSLKYNDELDSYTYDVDVAYGDLDGINILCEM